MKRNRRVLFAGAIVSVLSLFAMAVPASAGPEPTGNPQGVAAGNGCDMGPFHSDLAKQGEIGRNASHYPGQHKGASTC